MNIRARSSFIPFAMHIAVLALAAQMVQAQTPAQMEYERQQREYRQQQEQQRQQQQRQQELMNENARRQQEESRRLNAPTGQGQGQNPAAGYQGAPQSAPRARQAQVDATASTAGAQWVSSCSSPAYGGMDIYVARSTISRSGEQVKMWDMYDFKSVQTTAGVRFLSTKNHHEYDCRGARWRMLSTTGFAGHMGKGVVVASDVTTFPWERVPRGDFIESCYLKIACEKK